MKKKYRKTFQRKSNQKRFRRRRRKFLSKKDFLFLKWIKLLIAILLIIILIIKRKVINNVHIAVSIDKKYIYTFIVYLTSLLDNKAKSSFYTIHILSDNSTINKAKDKIDKVIKKFGNDSINIKYYNLEGEFKSAQVGVIPFASYYRISLPSKLLDIDKVIYTDTDMINFKDLSEMYNIKFKEKMYICAPLDYHNVISELKPYGIRTKKYINSGIIIMNLKEMRKDDIETKMRNFIKTNRLANFDQTVINAICYKNTQILPYKYGIFAFDSLDQLIELNNAQDIMYRFNESELIQAFKEPTLFHYYGKLKPWANYSSYKVYNRKYWWYYAKMSGFYQEILDYYHFDKNYADNLIRKIPEDGGFLRRKYKKFS